MRVRMLSPGGTHGGLQHVWGTGAEGDGVCDLRAVEWADRRASTA